MNKKKLLIVGAISSKVFTNEQFNNNYDVPIL